MGKSTFFNRLIGERLAIEDPISGVTRDRHYGRSDWNGVEFSVIDTGGYVNDSEDVFEEEIKKQVGLAIEEADVILFMLDAKEGVTSMDEDVSIMLRKSGKKVIVIANKADNNKMLLETAEFYSLGHEMIFPISAINGSGTGELLDAVVSVLPDKPQDPDPDIPKVAIVGRPNAGKSSLLNLLFDEEKSIVTPVAGTTRDSVNTRFSKFGFDLNLVDTAGLRRKSKVDNQIEFYSVMRSIRAIEGSDICLLVLDATRGLEAQDLNIINIIERNRKGLVIAVNKWDLVEKDHKTMNEYEKILRERLAPNDDVPIVFTSVLEKTRVLKLLEEVVKVSKNRSRRITTSMLNDRIQELIENHPPPTYKGKRVKVKYITQLPTPYPTIVFFCNLPQYLKENYKRFLEKKIREMWDFSGSPLILYFREK